MLQTLEKFLLAGMLAEGFDRYGHRDAEKNRILEIPLLSCYFSRWLNFSRAENRRIGVRSTFDCYRRVCEPGNEGKKGAL